MCVHVWARVWVMLDEVFVSCECATCVGCIPVCRARAHTHRKGHVQARGRMCMCVCSLLQPHPVVLGCTNLCAHCPTQAESEPGLSQRVSSPWPHPGTHKMSEPEVLQGQCSLPQHTQSEPRYSKISAHCSNHIQSTPGHFKLCAHGSTLQYSPEAALNC